MTTSYDVVLNPAVTAAIRATNDRVATQQATIERLEALTTLDWIVTADAVHTFDGERVLSDLTCDNDSDHSTGTVCFHDGPVLCPDCAVTLIREGFIAGIPVTVDVLL